jgi:hypothetical protein
VRQLSSCHVSMARDEARQCCKFQIMSNCAHRLGQTVRGSAQRLSPGLTQVAPAAWWACRKQAAAEPVAAQLAAKGLPANLSKESKALQISQLSTLLEAIQDPEVQEPEGESLARWRRLRILPAALFRLWRQLGWAGLCSAPAKSSRQAKAGCPWALPVLIHVCQCSTPCIVPVQAWSSSWKQLCHRG